MFLRSLPLHLELYCFVSRLFKCNLQPPMFCDLWGMSLWSQTWTISTCCLTLITWVHTWNTDHLQLEILVLAFPHQELSCERFLAVSVCSTLKCFSGNAICCVSFSYSECRASTFFWQILITPGMKHWVSPALFVPLFDSLCITFNHLTLPHIPHVWPTKDSQHFAYYFLISLWFCKISLC